MNKRIARIFPLIATVCMMGGSVSCTDKEFDFNKDFDKTIGFPVSVEMPVGSTEKIDIERFMTFKDAKALHLECDSNGDYTLKTESATYELPLFFPLPDIEVGRPTKLFDIALPDFLAGDNASINFHDVALMFSFENHAPVTYDLVCEIAAYNKGEEVCRIHIGGNDNGYIRIPSNGTKEIVISKTGEYGPSGAEKIANAGLSSLFTSEADLIQLESIKIKSTSSGASGSGSLKIYCALETDTALDEGSFINYDYVANGWKDGSSDDESSSDSSDEDVDEDDDEDYELDYEITSMELTFNIQNTLPLNVNLKATCIDIDGKPVTSGLKVDTECSVIAGKTSSGKISISGNQDGIDKVDGVILHIEGSAAPGYYSTRLNAHQNLQLTEIKAYLKGNCKLTPKDR